MPQIAYLGPQGTFAEQAARLFASGEDLLPCSTIPLAMTAVRASRADAACVPTENSVEGSVTATLDELAEGLPLVTVAETLLPVDFVVVTRTGTDISAVRSIASHPHALAQVQSWLQHNLPHVNRCAVSFTTRAAVDMLDGQYDAAVTSRHTAEHYSLRIVATGIADVPGAHTRFLLFRRPG